MARCVFVDRTWSGGLAVFVRGWRWRGIDQRLDWCARVDGYVDGPWSDEAAAPVWRLNAVEAQRARWRFEARKKVDIMRANSRVQAHKTRERARADWDVYRLLYVERWPGTEPIGFDRWSREKWRLWKSGDRDAVLHLNTRDRASAVRTLEVVQGLGTFAQRQASAR